MIKTKKYHTVYLFTFIFLFFTCYLDAASMVRRKKKDNPDDLASKEFLFMEKNFTSQSCTQWKQGDKFVYLSDDLSVLLHPETPLDNPNQSFKNKIFTFEGMTEESILGYKSYVNLIFDCEGIKYRFETGKSKDDMNKTSYKPLLPDLIQLSVLEKARELLSGKKLYIRTSIWYNDEGYEIEGRKYIPVTIIDVLPGNNILPIQFRFVDDIGKEGRVFGTLFPDANIGQFISFDRLFTFDNPRDKYKIINNENWSRITSGKVSKGMTKEECRLSLGRPNEVKRIPTYEGLKEQWFYNTGSYLFFEDGILTHFRL